MLVAVFVLVVSASLFAFTPLEAGSNERRIARVVGQYMPRMHYSKLPLSDDLSEKWFDNYIKALDSNKYFFIQQDIDQFSKYPYT
jgi:carboxyl-terminal processing protease